MNTLTNTDYLIHKGYQLLEGSRVNITSTKLCKNPYRLTDVFYILASKHNRGELLTTSELDFLNTFISTPFPQLKHKAWVLGNWYDVRPRDLKSHNLKLLSKQSRNAKILVELDK